VRRFGLTLAAAVLAVGCALLGSDKPAVSAVDAYKAAVDACRLYQLLPADKRTPEGDEACAEIEKVCPADATSDILPLDAPPPALGNKVMAL
jgi:hypothetical protein